MDNLKKAFSLYPRKRAKGKPTIYVRFRGPDGEFLPGRSSGQTSRAAAEAWAMNEILEGRIIVRQNVQFEEYAKNFFEWDGLYVKRVRTRQRKESRKMNRTHADHMNGYLKNHLIPYFGSKRLSTFTVADLEDWQDYMLEAPRSEKHDRPLSPSTINHMLICLRTVFNQAKKDGLVSHNPCLGVEALEIHPQDRGTLTPEETLALIEDPEIWGNRRDYFIAKLSSLTGMRLGEILALKRKCVDGSVASVEQSWEMKYGLKTPKTRSSVRPIYLGPTLAEELREFMKTSPYTSGEDFVFYSADRDKPYTNTKGILDSLYDAMAKIGIEEEERKRRNIVFHSLRHFANTYMRNAGIPDFVIRAYIGHASPSMTDHYTHVEKENFSKIIDAQERLLAHRNVG